MVKYRLADYPEKDVDLIYNFVNSLENNKKNPLPNDPLFLTFTVGVSGIVLLMILKMCK